MARRKKQNEESENLNNTTNESDDTFGLPEIEYEPLKRDEPVEEEPRVTETVAEETPSYEAQQESVSNEEEQYVPDYLQEERSSNMPTILAVLVIVLLAGVAVWFFGFHQPKVRAEEEKIRVAQELENEKARKQQADLLAEQKRIEDEKRVADSLASAKPSEGAIETLSERSGRYYVVVASAIDDDLIMDYAKDLSKKGVSSKIIPPFGKTKFYRIAIDVADTYADAQTNADSKKGGDYGNDVWVVKY